MDVRNSMGLTERLRFCGTNLEEGNVRSMPGGEEYGTVSAVAYTFYGLTTDICAVPSDIR